MSFKLAICLCLAIWCGTAVAKTVDKPDSIGQDDLNAAIETDLANNNVESSSVAIVTAENAAEGDAGREDPYSYYSSYYGSPEHHGPGHHGPGHHGPGHHGPGHHGPGHHGPGHHGPGHHGPGHHGPGHHGHGHHWPGPHRPGYNGGYNYWRYPDSYYYGYPYYGYPLMGIPIIPYYYLLPEYYNRYPRYPYYPRSDDTTKICKTIVGLGKLCASKRSHDTEINTQQNKSY